MTSVNHANVQEVDILCILWFFVLFLRAVFGMIQRHYHSRLRLKHLYASVLIICPIVIHSKRVNRK